MEIEKQEAPQVPEKFPEPLERGVIVKRARLKVEGLLYIPDSKETATNIGYVMAVAEDTLGMIEVGMKVIFNSRANAFIIHEEESYVVLHENDVYAQVKTIKHDNIDIEEDILVPFNKSVLVRKGQSEIKMASGIILPDNQKLINYGIVIGVGKNVNKKIQVGKKVMFNLYSDFSFLFKGKEVNSMYEVDIQVILDHDSMAGIEMMEKERRADIELSKLPEQAPKEVLKGTKFHNLDKTGGQ